MPKMTPQQMHGQIVTTEQQLVACYDAYVPDYPGKAKDRALLIAWGIRTQNRICPDCQQWPPIGDNP